MALFSFSPSSSSWSVQTPTDWRSGRIQSTAAIREIANMQESRHPTLDLDFVPIPLGGKVTGKIALAVAPDSQAVFQLAFSCINLLSSLNSSSSSSNNSVLENVFCTENQTVMAVDGCIPVAFDVSPVGQETDTSQQGDQVIWRLEVWGTSSGGAWYEEYEVPVLTPEMMPVSQAKWVATSMGALQDEAMRYQPPPESRIRVTTTLDGKTVYFFGAGRVLGPALFLLYGSSIMGLFPVFRPGGLLAYALMIVAIIMAGCAIWTLLRTTQVIIGSNTMEVQHALLGLNTMTITIPEADVVNIKPKTEIRVSGPGGTRLSYSLIVYCLDGKATAGSMVNDRMAARYLAMQMRARLKGG